MKAAICWLVGGFAGGMLLMLLMQMLLARLLRGYGLGLDFGQ